MGVNRSHDLKSSLIQFIRKEQKKEERKNLLAVNFRTKLNREYLMNLAFFSLYLDIPGFAANAE